MITGKLAVIQANALKNQLFFGNNSGLLTNFPCRRLKNGFAPLHPAPGQKPAWTIGMLDQQNPVFPSKTTVRVPNVRPRVCR